MHGAVTMSKRISGAPRRPRNPIAKDVRTPKYRTRVVPDKRWLERLKGEPKHPVEDKDKET
jgi:hypothetical protein